MGEKSERKREREREGGRGRRERQAWSHNGTVGERQR